MNRQANTRISMTTHVTTTVSVSIKPPHSGLEISIRAPVISISIVSLSLSV